MHPLLLRDPAAPLNRATLTELADAVAAQASIEVDPKDSATDRLFGAIMATVDVLQGDREAHLRVLARVQHAPQCWPLLLQLGQRQVIRLLEQTALLVDDRRQYAQRAGLLVVCAATVRAWQQDESRDLAPTLRTLDNNLCRASKLADWLGLGLQPV